MAKRSSKSKQAIGSGERQRNADAVQACAQELVERAEPAVAMALTGGRSALIGAEQAHQISAAMARDHDRGFARPTSEYVRETSRKR